jgi:hypothetical protein
MRVIRQSGVQPGLVSRTKHHAPLSPGATGQAQAEPDPTHGPQPFHGDSLRLLSTGLAVFRKPNAGILPIEEIDRQELREDPAKSGV